VFDGYYAGYLATNCYYSVFDGMYAGRQATNCYYSVFDGMYAGDQATTCYQSVFDGYTAGRQANGASNSIFLGPYAGTNTVRPNTLIIDAAYKGTNALIYGEFDTPMVRINGKLIVTNSVGNADPLIIDSALAKNALVVGSNGVVFVRGETNQFAAAGVYMPQPVGLFAQMSFASTNVIDMAYESYTNIVNGGAFTESLTNRFVVNLTTGFITNLFDGYYKISYSMDIQGDANVNGDEVEAEVFVNGAGDEHTATYRTINATSGSFPVTKSHIKYLPALSYVEVKVRNVSDVDQDFSIARANLIIGTP
jgi:hypothetical protein